MMISVIELPGLFRDAREATLVYTRLAARHAFKSYENFVVLGAFAAEPESIHSRRPTASLAELKGQKIRVNNGAEAAALTKLGATAVPLPINKTSGAISSGAVDGAMVPPAMLFEFGIGRVTSNHYMMRTSAALMLLAINRKKYEALPARAQDLIRQYSGEWTAQRYIEIIEQLNASVLTELKADKRRKVTFPSSADRTAAQRAFDSVIENWVGSNTHRAKRLEMVRAALATIRSGE